MKRARFIHLIGMILAGALAILPAVAGAAEGAGSTGASYLLHPVGSKSIAMGEVKSALLGDPFSWLSNPATLNDMTGHGLGLFHAEWIIDTRYDNVSYTYRLNDKVIFGGGFLFTYRPDIQGYDEAGIETMELKSNNYQVVLGIGFAPIDNLMTGVNVKYFKEKLDESTAGGVGVDLGCLYQVDRTGTTFGIAVQNLGQDISFNGLDEPLPLTFRGGASQTVIPKEGIVAVSAAFDLVKPRFEDLYVGAGVELEMCDVLAVRVGYCGQESRPGSGFTLGGGFTVRETVTIDYAWTPHGDLGDFHHISIFFGVPKKEAQTQSLLHNLPDQSAHAGEPR
ncbi:MAG TPA: PorV/PorQ family protein [Patescibacteria group bacterium]|nr:PorV/PorQ family protein [Patescibacteria group bacterium]